MKKAIYNDHVAALSLYGGVFRAAIASRFNILRLAFVEFRTRYAPVFA